MTKKEYEKAEETFERALRADPSHLPVLNELGRLYVTKKEYEKAEETFEKALKLEPYNPYIIPSLLNMYRMTNPQKGITVIDKCKVKLKWNKYFLNACYSIYEKLGNKTEAQQCRKMIIAIDPYFRFTK